jgi:hypothetical protein
MAERNAEIRKSRLRWHDSGHGLIEKWLYQYNFDRDKSTGLATMEFTEAGRE